MLEEPTPRQLCARFHLAHLTLPTLTSLFFPRQGWDGVRV